MAMWFTFSHQCHTAYEYAKFEGPRKGKGYLWPS